jgi:hypothetical protein
MLLKSRRYEQHTLRNDLMDAIIATRHVDLFVNSSISASPLVIRPTNPPFNAAHRDTVA